MRVRVDRQINLASRESCSRLRKKKIRRHLHFGLKAAKVFYAVSVVNTKITVHPSYLVALSGLSGYGDSRRVVYLRFSVPEKCRSEWVQKGPPKQ